MNDDLFLIFDSAFRKWNETEKRLKKKSLARARRGTNFNKIKTRPGYKRVRIPGTKRYVLMKMGPSERISKKQHGRRLGRKSYLRK